MRGSQGGWAGWGWGAGSPPSWLLCREEPPAIMRWGARSPGQPLDGWIRANSTRSLLSLYVTGDGWGAQHSCHPWPSSSTSPLGVTLSARGICPSSSPPAEGELAEEGGGVSRTPSNSDRNPSKAWGGCTAVPETGHKT